MARFTLALLLLFAIPSSAQKFPQKFPEQKTFTLSSTVEMSLAGLSIAGDAYTTHLLNDGLHFGEYNPIARPFVKSTPGQVAYFGTAFGGVILGNHLLRNHPRWRHAFNWSIIAGETFETVSNARYYGPYNRCERMWVQQGILVKPCGP